VSREKLELVQRLYAAWSSGDIAGATSAFADDVEWHGHPRLPEPGPYRSREEVERWMTQFREAWGELSADPVELIDAGDSVVALVHMSGRGRGSGVEVRGGVDVHVMTFEGDEVSYFRIYPGDFLTEHAELSEGEFELLILRVQEGLELPEMAERLGIPESEARSRYDRALALLRNVPGSERVS
jgi:ketosteroid isomerase-like protein